MRSAFRDPLPYDGYDREACGSDYDSSIRPTNHGNCCSAGTQERSLSPLLVPPAPWQARSSGERARRLRPGLPAWHAELTMFESEAAANALVGQLRAIGIDARGDGVAGRALASRSSEVEPEAEGRG